MKSLFKFCLVVAFSLSGQAFAQSIKIGDVAGMPGQTVTVNVTLTDPSEAIEAIDILLEHGATYDAVTPTGGASCGGDLPALPDLDACEWAGNTIKLYSIRVVNSGGFGTNPDPVIIARVNFTIPAGATPGTIDPIALGPDPVIGPGSATVVDGSIEVLEGPQPDWSSVPNSATGLDFGTLVSGTGLSSLAIQVTNIGEVDSNLTGTCTVPGGPYSMVVDSLGAGLAKDASSDISVQFDTAGLAPGTYNETMTCTHNGSAAAGETSPTGYPLTVFVRSNQTITGFAADPASGEVGGSSTLSATASSGLAVVFGSNTPSTCTVAGSTVSYLAAGICTVTANQAGDTLWLAAPEVTLDIDVAKADQTISGLAADPASGVVEGSSSLTATASSGLPVTFGSNTPSICTVSGSTVTYLLAGICTVSANQAGDADYNAAPQVTLDITVAKADQAITDFISTPANGDVGDTTTLSATGGNSGNPVTFGSITPSVCTVSGSTVTLLASGTCTVTADQAGDDNYNAATQVTLDIGVAKADQTISDLAADPATGVVDGSSTLSATASSGLPVTFSSSTPAVCTVTASTVSYLAAGTCTVTADQAGDDDYNAAPQETLGITVAKADQVITDFISSPANGDVGDTTTLSATGGDSGNPVTFGSITPSVCTVSGSTVTLLASGTCTVTADQAGDDNYNAATQVTLDIGVAKSDQTISGLAADPATGVVDGSSTLSATASSGLPVTFGSSTPAVCTVAASTVSYLAAGTCTVTADQAGDDDYNAAPQETLAITVDKADQVITDFISTPANGDVDDTTTLSATGGGSSNPVTFGSITPSVCTVSGSTVTLLASGTCTVTADQAGDDNYNAATQVTLDIGVAKSDQTISGLAADPSSGVINGSSTLSATASSGLPVTFGSSTPAVCTVAASTVSYLAAGTCTVTADQAGDDDYNAAPQVTLDITVAKLDQTITDFISTPANGDVGDTTTLSATGGDSGNPVTFGSSTPSVCTVSGSTVTLLASGTCTVTADQAGNDDYNDATQVTLDIGVAKADQTISGLAADPASGVVAETSSLSATASSGLPVSFGSSTPAVCSVSGMTVSYVAIGTCTVTADQAGDDDYNAAPQVTLDITVTQGSQTIIEFSANPNFGYVGSTSTLVAIASSGLTVTFASSTPSICEVSGDTVTYLEEGTCTVTANQAGDENYAAAPQVTLDIDVTLTAPTAIPTLSVWGLLTMFLIMLGVGGLVIRRKQFN